MKSEATEMEASTPDTHGQTWPEGNLPPGDNLTPLSLRLHKGQIKLMQKIQLVFRIFYSNSIKSLSTSVVVALSIYLLYESYIKYKKNRKERERVRQQRAISTRRNIT